MQLFIPYGSVAVFLLACLFAIELPYQGENWSESFKKLPRNVRSIWWILLTDHSQCVFTWCTSQKAENW